MIKNVYSVFDAKSQSFCNPFISQNDQTALRDFSYVSNDITTEIGRHPSDFSLFRVASFCFETASVTPEATPINLALAATLVRGE
jgi:hypothetical protein